MIRRNVLDRSGLFNVSLKYAEDLELFMRLTLFSRAGFINKPLTHRRIHPEQSISVNFDRWDWRVKIYSDFNPVIGKLSEKQENALEYALKHANFKLGECFWEQLAMDSARRSFCKSIGKNRWTPSAIIYTILSLLPKYILGFVRKHRKH